MGRSRSTAPSMADSSIGVAARAPLIDVFQHDHAGLHRDAEQRQESDARGDAEVGVRDQQRQQAADARQHTLTRISVAHFSERNMVYRMMKISRMVSGTMISRRALGALLALVFAFPVDVVAARQLAPARPPSACFFDRAAQVAAAHAVLDGDVALVAFAVDFRSAVALVDLAELRQRNAFAGGRQQANVFDGFLGVAVLRQIAHHQVVARLALQHLREGVAAHRGLNGVLHVGDVDLVARRLLAVHGDVQIRLAEHAEDAQILNSLERRA